MIGSILLYNPGDISAYMSDANYKIPNSVLLSGGGISTDGGYSLFSSIGIGDIDLMSDGQYKIEPGAIHANTPPKIVTQLPDRLIINEPQEVDIYLFAEEYDGQPLYWEDDRLPQGAVFQSNPNDPIGSRILCWDTSKESCTGSIEFTDVFILVADHDPDDRDNPANYKNVLDNWCQNNPRCSQPSGGEWESYYHYILATNPNLIDPENKDGYLNLGIDFKTVTFAFNCCTSVPTIDVSGETTICLGSSVNLDIAVEDLNGGGIIEFILIDGPSGSSFEKSNGNGTFFWTPDAVGTYCVTFKATNKCENSTEKQVCIHVLDNHPPSIVFEPTDPNITVCPDPGDPNDPPSFIASIYVKVDDPDDEDLRANLIEFSPNDIDYSFDYDTGLLTWNPVDSGGFILKFITEEDQCGETATCEHLVSVEVIQDPYDLRCLSITERVYELEIGYNPIGISHIYPNIHFAEDICSAIEDETAPDTQILSYNPDISSWERYRCQFNAPVNFVIEPSYGYFIKSGKAYDWLIEVSEIPSPKTLILKPGYNCLALPEWKGTMTASEILTQINAQGNDCTKLLIYDMTIPSWSTHRLAIPSHNNFIIQPKQAFFVYSQGSGQWELTK